MPAGSDESAASDVYFFLSYAHAPRAGWGDDSADKPVRDFYEDLAAEVARRAGPREDGPIGFADWEIPAGRNWRTQIGHVLGHCRAFVALYSPKYFESPFCGQEWGAFHRRESSHHADAKQGRSAIVPVMWTRTEDANLPERASRIHYGLPEAGELYGRRGMRELVVRSANHPAIRMGYQTALGAFAAHIVRVAETAPPLTKVHAGLELRPDENAFAGDWPTDVLRPLRIVVAASVRESSPPNANPQHYGVSPEQWRPFWPSDETPIAETAAMLAAADGYHPIVEFIGSCAELLDGAPPSAPTVLLVDPWATQDAELAARLSAFDAISRDKPWVRLVIPWDKDDSGGGGQVLVLEHGLQSVLGRMRSQCSLNNPQAVAGLPTVGAFGARLPGVIAAAERGYFQHTRTYQTWDGGPGKPGLHGGPPGGPPPDGK